MDTFHQKLAAADRQPGYSGRKAIEKSTRTRQRILDAAAKRFSEHGYALTRLSDIAAAAGTHAGAMYYYFKSREDIVEEVLMLSATRVLEYVRARLEHLPSEATYRERISLAIDAHLSRNLSKDAYTAAYMRIHDQVPQALREKLAFVMRQYGDYWAELIEGARKAGEIRRDQDSSVMRLLLLGSMTWALEWYHVGKLTPSQIAKQVATTFFEGVGAGAPAGANAGIQNKNPMRDPCAAQAGDSGDVVAAAIVGGQGTYPSRSRFVNNTRTAALWALAASAVFADTSGRPATLPTGVGDYFLSTTNPLATTAQRDLEARALRILQSPEVAQGKQRAIYRWKIAVGTDPPAEAWPMFDSAMDEYAFNYVLKGANSDANYPQVLQVYVPPHEWFGMHIPGGRWGGDNPDNSYRIIPLDGSSRYEVLGQRFSNAPSDVTYTLVGDWATSKTLASLEGRDVQVNSDGSFTLTVDPKPADGRRNHLQSKPNAAFLFIRDSRGDWRQTVDSLRVRRLDPPSAPAVTEQQMAERAADQMVDGVPLVYWFMRGTQIVPPNTVTQPHSSGAVGGLFSQVASVGLFKLADDEAMVITVSPAGAAFRDIVLHDYWYRTIDYPHHTSSLNDSQAKSNADGTVTYVASVKDPKVYNWLDTVGLHQVMMLHRWQGLPRGKTPAGEPLISAKLVKLADLPSALPKDTKWVTPEERRLQLAERLESYMTRWVAR